MASGSVSFEGTITVAVAKTKLGADLIIPSSVQEVVNISPFMIPVVETADLPNAVNFSLESSDTDLSPTLIAVLLHGPQDGTITSSPSGMVFKTYDLNTPVQGGDVLKLHGTNIIDPVTDPFCGAHLQIMDGRSNKMQTFWTNPAAANNAGTTVDSYVDGATYRFNNCLRISKTYAIVSTNTTRTIDDSIGGTYKLSSPDFKTNLPQDYGFQTMFENTGAATGNVIPTVVMNDVDIPTEPVVAVTESIRSEGLSSAGGVFWISGVGYQKQSRTR